jgi:glucan phosphoethanolaminetransferase (alkaline phosphatase superfamily)
MKNSKNIAIVTTIVGAIATIAIMLSTTSPPSNLSDILVTLGFYAWVLLPFALLLALTFFIHRKAGSPAARVSILLTSILVVASSVLLYWSSIFNSESSTSALVFIFIPLYALVAIGAVYPLAWLLSRSLMPKAME